MFRPDFEIVIAKMSLINFYLISMFVEENANKTGKQGQRDFD